MAAQQAAQSYVGGSSLLYGQVTAVTVANTVTETALVNTTSALGTNVFPASNAVVGQSFDVWVAGVRSTNTIGTPTLTLNFYLGSVLIGTAVITDVANLAGQGWSAHLTVTVVNAGASGSVQCQGMASFETLSMTALPVAITNASTVTGIDFTSTKAFSVKAQWGTASANNTLTCNVLTVYSNLLAATVNVFQIAGATVNRIMIDNGSTATFSTNAYSLPASADTLVGRASTDTLTNKTLTTPIIATISNTGTVTLPTATDTLVARTTTDTLTNKRITKRVHANSAANSLTPNCDSYDVEKITLTSGTAFTLNAPSGTPTDRQMISIEVTWLTGTAAYTFNSIYVGSVSLALPTTATASKRDKLLFQYNSDLSKWELTGLLQGYT